MRWKWKECKDQKKKKQIKETKNEETEKENDDRYQQKLLRKGKIDQVLYFVCPFCALEAHFQ